MGLALSDIVCNQPGETHSILPKSTIWETWQGNSAVKGEVVEHVIVNSHPYELITRTCWQMDGAKDLAWPWRLQRHATKVNAVTRGQPGRNVGDFDPEGWNLKISSESSI